MIQLGPLTVGRLAFGAPVTLVAPELDGYHVTIATAGRVHTRHAGHAGHEVFAGTSPPAPRGAGSGCSSSSVPTARTRPV